MEHRITRRFPLALDVFLSCGRRDFGWFQTLELGRDGFSLRGLVPTLRINSLVGVLMEARVDGETVQVERRAVVVHLQDDRMGLMWAEADTGVHSVLRSRTAPIAAAVY